MTVEQFVAARRERWQRLSKLCDRLQDRGAPALSGAELGEFGALYRLAASDLAYASAHVPQVELLAWLNQLVLRAHGHLSARPRQGLRGLAAFCRTYPARWRAAWPYLATAAAVYGGALLLAWLTVWREPRLAGLFVPLELTQQVQPARDGTIPATAFVALSGFVLTNNLTAALLAFAGGVVGGLGTVVALVRNGLLLGALAGLAHHTSGAALWLFAASILPHGVVEIAALLTSAAGGLQLGWAVVHGGVVTRPAALRAAGREALALLLGSLPWLAVAALLEGFLTPLAAPAGLKVGFGLLTGGVLAYYLALGRGESPA